VPAIPRLEGNERTGKWLNMSLEDDIAFFERVPTLATLGKQALRVLAIGAETRHLQSGAVLFYAGELTDAGYIVQEGALQIEPAGGSAEYAIGPGTLLGELSLLTDAVSPVTAIALEPTVVVHISRNLFRKMLEGYPSAAKRLRDTMAERLDAWTQELEGVQRKMDKAK
jgi:CRP-like cAMP-binding protein